MSDFGRIWDIGSFPFNNIEKSYDDINIENKYNFYPTDKPSIKIYPIIPLENTANNIWFNDWRNKNGCTLCCQNISRFKHNCLFAKRNMINYYLDNIDSDSTILNDENGTLFPIESIKKWSTKCFNSYGKCIYPFWTKRKQNIDDMNNMSKLDPINVFSAIPVDIFSDLLMEEHDIAIDNDVNSNNYNNKCILIESMEEFDYKTEDNQQIKYIIYHINGKNMDQLNYKSLTIDDRKSIGMQTIFKSSQTIDYVDTGWPIKGIIKNTNSNPSSIIGCYSNHSFFFVSRHFDDKVGLMDHNVIYTKQFNELIANNSISSQYTTNFCDNASEFPLIHMEFNKFNQNEVFMALNDCHVVNFNLESEKYQSFDLPMYDRPQKWLRVHSALHPRSLYIIDETGCNLFDIRTSSKFNRPTLKIFQTPFYSEAERMSPPFLDLDSEQLNEKNKIVLTTTNSIVLLDNRMCRNPLLCWTHYFENSPSSIDLIKMADQTISNQYCLMASSSYPWTIRLFPFSSSSTNQTFNMTNLPFQLDSPTKILGRLPALSSVQFLPETQHRLQSGCMGISHIIHPPKNQTHTNTHPNCITVFSLSLMGDLFYQNVVFDFNQMTNSEKENNRKLFNENLGIYEEKWCEWMKSLIKLVDHDKTTTNDSRVNDEASNNDNHYDLPSICNQINQFYYCLHKKQDAPLKRKFKKTMREIQNQFTDPIQSFDSFIPLDLKWLESKWHQNILLHKDDNNYNNNNNNYNNNNNNNYNNNNNDDDYDDNNQFTDHINAMNQLKKQKLNTPKFNEINLKIEEEFNVNKSIKWNETPKTLNIHATITDQSNQSISISNSILKPNITFYSTMNTTDQNADIKFNLSQPIIERQPLNSSINDWNYSLSQPVESERLTSHNQSQSSSRSLFKKKPPTGF